MPLPQGINDPAVLVAWKAAVRQGEQMKAESLAKKDYAGYVRWFDGHEKLKPFMEIKERLSDQQYWRLLAEVWSNIEVSYPDRVTWLRLFQSTRPRRELLMKVNERRVLAAMPDRLTLFRGYTSGLARRGLSWTLSEETAVFFGRDYGRGERRAWFGLDATQRVAMLAVGRCHKQDVLAYFNGRREQEIVVEPSNVLSLKSRRI